VVAGGVEVYRVPSDHSAIIERDNAWTWAYQLKLCLDAQHSTLDGDSQRAQTISILAHLSRAIVADLTDGGSVPHELMAIVPALPSVPVQPIVQEPAAEYAYVRTPREISVGGGGAPVFAAGGSDRAAPFGPVGACAGSMKRDSTKRTARSMAIMLPLVKRTP
jgi:hypothetical protein